MGKRTKDKTIDSVFNKDNRRDINNFGIINLDSNNGPGTHWSCYVDSFYFDPYGIPPPENIPFSKRYNTLQLKKRYLFFVVTFVFFFFFLSSFFFFTLKKIQDGNSIYNILYKILDLINPSENETILKDCFINYWNV